MSKPWINNYIGLPFKDKGRSMAGVDCWGLVQQIYRRERGIELPDYLIYETVSDKDQVVDTVNKIRSEGWVAYPKTIRPEQFDVILFESGGKPLHVGLMIDPRRFVHSAQDDYSRIERYTSGIWFSRVEGFYRYVGK
jgi:cell wall-associated NlpC family hydrolase